MAPLVPGFLTSPKGQLIPDLGPASHSLVMSKSNGCTTESNSLWRSPRYKTLACKVRSTRKGQLHRPPPLLFPFWKLQRKIHRMIQILVPLCPAFPALVSSRDGYLLEPTVCTKGSQASCGVWREDSGLDSRPCRKRRPSSRDDGGVSWVF